MGNKSKNQGFAYIIPIIIVGVLAVVIGFFALTHKEPEKKNLQTSTLYQHLESNDEVFAALENDLNIALQSGGINPDLYDAIDHKVSELEAQGFDKEKIAVLRSKMSQLNIGDQNQQSPEPGQEQAQATESEPSAKQFLDTVKSALPQSSSSSAPPQNPPPPPSPTTPQPSCQSNTSPVFTHHITDTSKINYVAPPPTMGSGSNLKTHSYIGTDGARVPVYAPVDMVLEDGAHYTIGPYWLGFRISCEMKLRFIHITEPIQAVKDVFPAEPQTDSKSVPIKNEISFKAGELIGYTNTGNWDFGVYNTASKNRYAGDPDWGNSWVYTTAVCPFDYFPENMRTVYTSKFNTTILGGNPPHGESFCKKYFE